MGKYLFKDRIAERLIHFRRQQLTVVVVEEKTVFPALLCAACFLPEQIDIADDDPGDGVPETPEQLRCVIIQIDQVFCAED